MTHRVTSQLTVIGQVASDPVHALGPKPTREQLLAALDREIARGLEAGELVIPESRRRDHAWLKRNVWIDNRNARGQAVFRLAQELFKMDVRAAMKRAASETRR
jgi:hypothetical protein